MQQKGQAGGNQDTGYDFLWGLGLAFAIVLLIWYFGHTYMATYLYKIKFYEIEAIQFVLNYWNAWIVKIPVPLKLTVDAADLHTWMHKIRAGDTAAEFQMMYGILDAVGKYLRYPIILVLLILSYVVYTKSVVLKFKTTFNMKSMKVSEQKDWPQIVPVANLNLVKEDIDKGPWAMALSPMQFCKANNLLKEKTGDDGRPAVDLIAGDAHQLFIMQLGPLWTTGNALPIYAKALFGAFAASANNSRDDGLKLLKQINASAQTSGKLNFEGAEELLAKYYNTKVVAKVVQKHAYVLTVMASMLELARTDGVFASSEFLWLKPIDRRLWYMLNTVGRQTVVSEISGPYAHWLAERKWGTGIRTPMVEESVKALNIALSEIIYERDEEK